MNYTSIEQSKKLLELGLKPETADMNHYEKDDGWVTLPKGQISYGGFQIIPCWSVGALLELMPKIIKNSKRELFEFSIRTRGINWFVGYFGYEVKNSPYLIEACYDTITWLLQNNYIKSK